MLLDRHKDFALKLADDTPLWVEIEQALESLEDRGVMARDAEIRLDPQGWRRLGQQLIRFPWEHSYDERLSLYRWKGQQAVVVVGDHAVLRVWPVVETI